MASLNDARLQALRSLGFEGTTNDMLLEYYKGLAPGESQLNDAELAWLKVVYPAGTALTVPDLWFEYLRSEGYSGARNDMETAYWLDQIIP